MLGKLIKLTKWQQLSWKQFWPFRSELKVNQKSNAYYWHRKGDSNRFMTVETLLNCNFTEFWFHCIGEGLLLIRSFLLFGSTTMQCQMSYCILSVCECSFLNNMCRWGSLLNVVTLLCTCCLLFADPEHCQLWERYIIFIVIAGGTENDVSSQSTVFPWCCEPDCTSAGVSLLLVLVSVLDRPVLNGGDAYRHFHFTVELLSYACDQKSS